MCRSLDRLKEETLRYARECAGEAFHEIPAQIRASVRVLIVDHLERGLTVSRLASSLFDSFATLNLDWHLIASTEMGECNLQGFIAAQPHGAFVHRLEAYQGACSTCAAMDGSTFEVVPSDRLGKDRSKQVWRGKSNIHGQQRRATNISEWGAAGLQHPGCRGSWTLRTSRPVGFSASFAEGLEAALEKARPWAARTPKPEGK